MNVYRQDATTANGIARSHPWTTATSDPASRYYDFKVHPELIPTVLEDFRPWDDSAAVREFYRLIATLNAPGSPFETNDCAFNAPDANVDLNFGKSLQASGRLMMLFRDLTLNTRHDRVKWLEQRLLESLAGLDDSFPWTAVATALTPTRYLELPEGKQAGHQLAIHFFAWGDTDEETIDHFGRIVSCLTTALAQVMSETPTEE
jgi:hypothetical protein